MELAYLFDTNYKNGTKNFDASLISNLPCTVQQEVVSSLLGTGRLVRNTQVKNHPLKKNSLSIIPHTKKAALSITLSPLVVQRIPLQPVVRKGTWDANVTSAGF